MKPEEILEAMDGVSEKTVAEARKKPAGPWVKIVAAAACAVLLIGGGLAVAHQNSAPQVPQISQAAAAEEAGPKKFLNYDGCQYAYLENGASYTLPEGILGQELGTLDHEIIIGKPDHLHDDYAATFGVGGTIYALNTYDPAFRIAVELDGRYYLCEKSGHLDESPVDAGAYFEAADFREIVTSIDIQDHSGAEVLKTIRGKKAEKLLDNLAQMAPVELTSELFQAIGEAQQAGESYLLALRLEDGTSCEMYVIPSLSIGMLGNNRYTLAESFEADCGRLFAGLEQKPMAAH